MVRAIGGALPEKISPLKVRVVFEPNRLAGEHLADAYEQVVSTRRRLLVRKVQDEEIAGEAQQRDLSREAV